MQGESAQDTGARSSLGYGFVWRPPVAQDRRAEAESKWRRDWLSLQIKHGDALV